MTGYMLHYVFSLPAARYIIPWRPFASVPLPRQPLFATLLALLVPFHFAQPVWAWGRLGYRVISRLAEKNLTPAARTAVTELLEPGESLAKASTWADEVRGHMRKTVPWHYVDVPLDESKYDAKYSGPKIDCVVDKINEFRLTLKDKSKSVEDRRFALRFLIHCVEGMHVPLHVGDNGDKGGNRTQVGFFDRGTNMHALWDTGMTEQVRGSLVGRPGRARHARRPPRGDERYGRGLGEREPTGH
jgi:hypothetical protein